MKFTSDQKAGLTFAFIPVALLAALITISLFLRGYSGKHTEIPLESTIDTTVKQLSREDTIVALATAFVAQESNYNSTAVSPCGQWVGCLQLSEIMVREANRIVGFECFYPEDRYDRQGSYAIFKIVQEYHNPNLKIDRAIDIWNPKCPASYRNNVKKYFAYNVHNFSELGDYFGLE